MKITKTVIQENNGENRGTYSSIGFLENFNGDESETVSRFVSWDCNIPVECAKYRRIEVDIPSWMNESEYLRNKIDLKYVVSLAGDIVYGLSRDEFYKLVSLDSKWQFWYGWAMKSKNKFICDLVEQFQKWISGDGEYSAPLSYRQFEAGTKYCPLWKVDGIESSVYRDQVY